MSINPPAYCRNKYECAAQGVCLHHCGYNLMIAGGKDAPAARASAPPGWTPSESLVLALAKRDLIYTLGAFFLYQKREGVTQRNYDDFTKDPNMRSRLTSIKRKLPSNAFYFEMEDNKREVDGKTGAHRRHFVRDEYRPALADIVLTKCKELGLVES